MLIDSHVNLHAHQYDEDRQAVIDRAREAGIGLMVTICDKIPSFEAVHAIAMARRHLVHGRRPPARGQGP
jgi:TatD DNase family protein